MKKIALTIFTLGIVLLCTEAKAQTSQSSSLSSKDEFWGTAKTQVKGASVDAAERRAQGLDPRFNDYEDGRKGNFAKKSIMNSKRMKEILKMEKKMQKKHKRDLRRLRRSRNN